MSKTRKDFKVNGYDRNDDPIERKSRKNVHRLKMENNDVENEDSFTNYDLYDRYGVRMKSAKY